MKRRIYRRIALQIGVILSLIVIWLAFSGGRERNRKYRGKDHPGRTTFTEHRSR